MFTLVLFEIYIAPALVQSLVRLEVDERFSPWSMTFAGWVGLLSATLTQAPESAFSTEMFIFSIVV